MADRNSTETANPDRIQAELGRRIRALRLARNLTQGALAREAGVGLRTLRRLEAGDSPSLDSFLRIVAALELTERLLDALPSSDARPPVPANPPTMEPKRARSVRQGWSGHPWTWTDGQID